jgi:hypothetical protein
LIRHVRLRLTQAAPIRLLAITMIEPSFRAPLVAPVGGPPLPPASLVAALGAAVAVSAIAVRADEENRLAALTKAEPLPKNRFAVNRRHASSQAELDNGSGLMAGWNQLCLVYLSMVAEHEPCRSNGRVPSISRLETRYFVQPSLWMIGPMIAPSAR